MGSITERPRANGSTAYMARVFVKREGKVIYSESKTFDRRPAATAWINKREKELSQPGALDLVKVQRPTLAKAIERYKEETNKGLGKTQSQVFEKIKEFPIASMLCEDIRSSHIVELAQGLARGDHPAKSTGKPKITPRTPQTVGNYLANLSSVFTVARPAWNYPLDRQAMDDAIIVAKKLGIVSRSKQRDRRPTLAELDKIMAHFEERTIRQPASNPMEKIVPFAIFSTRRQEEITRIRWDDLETEARRVLVRDMKHPGEKIGNDTWCDLPEPALEIILTMPRVAPEIFPFSTDAISASFTRACQFLGIEDLHFHDLRHEGISRLFEMGYNIPHAAAVSGHKSWQSLKRYTHLRHTGDKFAGWKWIDVALRPLTSPRWLTTPAGGRSNSYEAD